MAIKFPSAAQNLSTIKVKVPENTGFNKIYAENGDNLGDVLKKEAVDSVAAQKIGSAQNLSSFDDVVSNTVGIWESWTHAKR